MSDIIQTVETTVKPVVTKESGIIAKFFKAIGNGIVSFVKFIGKILYNIGKQFWSLVSDHGWDFDPWKAGGIACFIIAAIWGNDIFKLVLVKNVFDTGTLGILAGLVTGFITVGTFLFGQAKEHDSALISGKQ
jgi:hypothetical protein